MELGERVEVDGGTAEPGPIPRVAHATERRVRLVGNGLLTLLTASESEESLQALNALLLQFTMRQIQREAGLSESQIISCEALEPQRLN